MPIHFDDIAEVAVFDYWIDRLKREFREPLKENE